MTLTVAPAPAEAGLSEVSVGADATVNVRGELMTVPVVTVTLRAPAAAAAATTKLAVIWVALTTDIPVIEIPTPLTDMLDFAEKLVPVRVTLVVVPGRALAGVRPVKVDTAEMVNVPCPMVVEPMETVMVRGPGVAFLSINRLAVNCEELATVVALAVTPDPENAMVAPGTKLDPLRIRFAVPPA